MCLYGIDSVFFLTYVYMHFFRVDRENMIESIRSTQHYFLFLRMIVVKCTAILLRRKKKNFHMAPTISIIGKNKKKKKRCGEKKTEKCMSILAKRLIGYRKEMLFIIIFYH